VERSYINLFWQVSHRIRREEGVGGGGREEGEQR